MKLGGGGVFVFGFFVGVDGGVVAADDDGREGNGCGR